MKLEREVRKMLNYRQDVAEYLIRHNRTVDQEVKLIEQKKSGLSASQREFVLTYFDPEVVEETIIEDGQEQTETTDNRNHE